MSDDRTDSVEQIATDILLPMAEWQELIERLARIESGATCAQRHASECHEEINRLRADGLAGALKARDRRDMAEPIAVALERPPPVELFFSVDSEQHPLPEIWGKGSPAASGRHSQHRCC